MSRKREYDFDVFISYSRLQLDWVARVYDQWTCNGLRVFLDLKEIRPGESVLDGISRGLKSSRYVVLLLTFEAIRSPWVTLERSQTFLRSGRGRLIPVLLEPRLEELIEPHLRAVNFVDLTDPDRRQASYDALNRMLGISNPLALPELPNPRLAARTDHDRKLVKNHCDGIRASLSQLEEYVVLWEQVLSDSIERIHRSISDVRSLREKVDQIDDDLFWMTGQVSELRRGLTDRIQRAKEDRDQLDTAS